MYAIIKSGGRQYRVAQDDVIAVNRLVGSEGEEIVIDEVLLVSDDGAVKIGAPYVEGAKVLGTVVRHYRGRKIKGFHYKPKKDERRRYGHRQELTSVAIKAITV